MKKLIAYSSVAHMAFVTIGLFAFNRQGIEGAMIVMLSHGLVSGALFLCVGVIYDRLHTREIDRYGGLADNMPGYALLFMLFTMAVGRPAGHQRLRRRVPRLVGRLRGQQLGRRWSPPPASSSARPTCSTSTGGSRSARSTTPTPPRCPISTRANVLLLAPIAAAVLWMGVYPESFLAPMRADVGLLLDAGRARQARRATPS